MGNRSHYTEEFKKDAVRLALSRGNRTLAEISEELGVSQSMLHRWHKKYGGTARAGAVSGLSTIALMEPPQIGQTDPAIGGGEPGESSSDGVGRGDRPSGATLPVVGRVMLRPRGESSSSVCGARPVDSGRMRHRESAHVRRGVGGPWRRSRAGGPQTDHPAPEQLGSR